MHASNEHRSLPLDCITSGFVGTLSGAEIPLDVGVAKGREFNVGCHNSMCTYCSTLHGDAGKGLVGPTGEAAEHGVSFGIVVRFAENETIHRDCGVGRDHQRGFGFAKQPGNGRRFALGEPSNVRAGCFPCQGSLVDVGRNDAERKAESGEK